MAVSAHSARNEPRMPKDPKKTCLSKSRGLLKMQYYNDVAQFVGARCKFTLCYICVAELKSSNFVCLKHQIEFFSGLDIWTWRTEMSSRL